MDKNKLQALIDLLDDPDEIVYKVVEKELLKENNEIIPVLEQKWENSYDENFQERIENLIQNLHFKENGNKLKMWLKSNDSERDLFTGALIVNQFQFPDVNKINIQLKIEKIRKKIWLELNTSLTLLEKTTILNYFLFNVYKYSVDESVGRSYLKCFLNQLLYSKKGNPFSISILYMILARELELPAFFIDFPKNPLIAIVEPALARKVHGPGQDSDVLFYINPTNKGSITSRKEIEYHLKKNNYSPLQYFTEPKSDVLLIKRLFESLKDSYGKSGLIERQKKAGEFLELFDI